MAKKAASPEAKPQVAPKASKGQKEVAPQKPSESERDAKLDECKKRIDVIKKKQLGLKEKIDESQKDNQEYQAERSQMWEKLKAIAEERKAVRETKDQLATSQKAERDGARALKLKEKDVGKLNEDSIDKKIREIEYQMSTASLTLKEEKLRMAEIKKLKAQRPEAAKAQAELDRMKAEQQSTAGKMLEEGGNVEEALAKCKTEVARLNDEHNAQYQLIQDHQGARKDKMDGAKKWIDERNALKEDIQKINEERDAIWTEYKEKSKAFNNWEKARREELRRKNNLEWEAKQAAWKAEEASRELEEPSPFLEDSIKLDQAIQFCVELQPKENKTEEVEEKKELTQLVEGAKILCKKSDRDTFFTIAPKKKNLRKKGGDKVKSSAIKHTSETFAIFEAVAVTAPLNMSELEKTLETLNAKQAELKTKTEEWEVERKQKIEDANAINAEAKEAAAEAAAAATEEPAEA